MATSTYGIAIEDIVLDPLGDADRCRHHPCGKDLGADLAIDDELGVNMTLGASNVSFGMPDREAIGQGSCPWRSPRGSDHHHGCPFGTPRGAWRKRPTDSWTATRGEPAWIAAHRAQQEA